MSWLSAFTDFIQDLYIKELKGYKAPEKVCVR